MKLRLTHPTVGEIAFPVPDGGQVVLGRRGGSTGIELNWDPKISRQHARVWVEGGRLWIEDLGSRNGTWHEGTRLVGPFRIEPGMRVRVGETGLENAELPDQSLSSPTLPGMTLADLGLEYIEDTQIGARPLLDLADELELPDDLDDLDDLDDRLDAERPAPLPSASALAPTPTPPLRAAPPEVVLDGHRAIVCFADRDAFDAFWRADLTKTGVFVPTDEPPAFGAQLDIEVATPDGLIHLRGNVVHVVDAEMAKRFDSPCGAGLQIVEIDAATRARVDAYLSGDRPVLQASAADTRDDGNVELAVRDSKRLIARVERGELYAAIDLAPEALQSEVDARLAEIQSRLSNVTSDLSPPQAARLTPARKCLAQVVSTLGSPERRLQYDFAQGHVNAKKRLQAAADRTGPSAALLRRAWRICFPRKVEQAQQLLRSAFEMRRTRSYDEALTLGREALAKDPFWIELRRTIETWESLYQTDQSAA